MNGILKILLLRFRLLIFSFLNLWYYDSDNIENMDLESKKEKDPNHKVSSTSSKVDQTKLSKKSSSSISEENLDLSTEEGLRKIIECPICLEIPLPPIYLCSKGHIVCSSCQLRTDFCPLCRARYGNTRSFVAESIVEKCTLRCKHMEQGCTMTCKGSEMPLHLKNCDFRPVKCNDCGGKWVEYTLYHTHLTEFHKINGVNQSEGFVVYNMNLMRSIRTGEKFCWPQYYFNAFGKTFLLRLYATNWFICSWVGLLGSKDDCEKYQVKIELHLPSDDTMMHMWSGRVCHFRDDPSLEVCRRGRGLTTPLETMLEVAAVSTDVAEWMYNVKITEVQIDAPPPPAPAPTVPCTPIISEVSQQISFEGNDGGDGVAAAASAVDREIENQRDEAFNQSLNNDMPAPTGTFYYGGESHSLDEMNRMHGPSFAASYESAYTLANAYASSLRMAASGNLNSLLCSDWDDSDSATDYDQFG